MYTSFDTLNKKEKIHMPIMQKLPIHCCQCRTFIRFIWLGDARTMDDLQLVHHSLCSSCKKKKRLQKIQFWKK